MYGQEEYLPLSGIQHFCFCPRQWALIHIEQQWQENLLTVEGRILHEKVHDPQSGEKRDGILISRGMAIHSHRLGLNGICDVVEFIADEHNGVSLKHRKGSWLPIPVEYKRGRPKASDADRLQLCAQAICLEEMLCCSIGQGYLFYGETRRRETVCFDQTLRKQVEDMACRMHEYFKRQTTPKAKPTSACRSCSLAQQCLPHCCTTVSAQEYIDKLLEEELI